MRVGRASKGKLLKCGANRGFRGLAPKGRGLFTQDPDLSRHPGGPKGLIDRSGGKADIGAKLVSLASVSAPAYPADQLPPELAALPAIKPGSRGLAA